MDLDDFNINQRVSIKGTSHKGKTRIKEHGSIWRIKNKVKQGQIPWIKNDSILLESLKDNVTSSWLNLIVDKDFKLI